MARFLSRALIGTPRTLIRDPCSSHRHHLLPARFLDVRGRSDRSARPELIELDLGAAEREETEVDVFRRVDDAIHAILIRKSAPDWLPFIPGSSYWVPPRRRANGLVELVGKLANPLSEEETMSLTTIHGWPSSSYFVEGTSPHPVKKSRKKLPAQSDDEE
ncbi:hypothetical protein Cni_G28569 [Canna indica]|uniref:Uncharacterized protein n=1 Tax=Canna indica TaxID=4628 RepID=A0AAQ3L2R6_9LILI|nr:hypothetical protein Cni_G28569 [Canna indica]